MTDNRFNVMLFSQKQNIALGHRVVNMRGNGPVPFGLIGTVTGMHKDDAEILFDEAFLGGSTLGGRFDCCVISICYSVVFMLSISHRCKDFRGLKVPKWTLLNLSLPAFAVTRSSALSSLPL